MSGINHASPAVEYFNRLNDRFFKFLFATEAWKFLLIELLNEVLRDIKEGFERLPEILDLFYGDREAVALYKADKVPRFDVVAMTGGRRLFHLEVQVAKDRNILDRILNYAARHYLTFTGQGEAYLPAQVVVVVLADFILFEGKKGYHTLIRPVDVESGAWSMRGLEFHIIELPKLRRLRRKPRTGLENFLYYLCDIGGEKMMQAVAEADWRVAEMRRLEEQFRSNPALMVDYQNHEQARRDFEMEVRLREAESEAHGEERGILIGEERGRREGILIGEERGEKRGIKLGRAEGREEALLATARRMLDEGMPPEQVARLTVLPIEEVRVMRK